MDGSRSLGQFYPVDSPLHALDPRAKILSVVLLALGLFFVKSIPGLLLMAVAVLVLVVVSRVPIRIFLRLPGPVLFIVVFTALFQVLFYRQGEVLVQWGILEIHEGGLRMGFFLAGRILLIVWTAGLLTATTGPVALADGLEDLLSPLKKLRFPAHEVAMMVTIALRFIPTLQEEAARITRAQAARGRELRRRRTRPACKVTSAGIPPPRNRGFPAGRRTGRGDGEPGLQRRRRGTDSLPGAAAWPPGRRCFGRDRAGSGALYRAVRFAGLVEYDGAGFAGWASQPGLRTVEGTLSEALNTVLRHPYPVKLAVAGRTDAGVHARGQVVSFDAETNLTAPSVAYRTTAVLPPDLALRRCVVADDYFDARRSARSRGYEYRVVNAPVRSPLARRCASYVAKDLNLNLLQKAAALVLGTHDFRAFTPTKSYHTRFERLVTESWWEKKGDLLVYGITAGSFLYGMVRALVGTMLEVAGGRRSLADFELLLSGGRRDEAGPSAPSRGLTLVRVEYDGLDL